MADPARARKLAVRIRQIVSAAIEMQIKDPRLGMVTVTDAKVTGDLREATVFYTVYGDETQIADSAKALTSATGILRATVGKQTGIKFVPTLTFVADIVPDTARELEVALERVRHADAELARAREGAQYAGDADPYRKPAEDEDDDEDLDDDTVAPGLPMTVSTTCPSRAGAQCERACERTNEHSTAGHEDDERQRGGLVTEVDPDPYLPDEGQGESVLGGRDVPGAGDPTDGGKHGQVGAASSIRVDEPGDGNQYPVGGGNVAEEQDAPPVADPGPDA